MEKQKTDRIDPQPANRQAPVSTSRTLGYDSAQTEGYVHEAHNREARRTTNEVHSNANAADDERTENERKADADKDDSGKAAAPSGPASSPGAPDSYDGIADPVPMD